MEASGRGQKKKGERQSLFSSMMHSLVAQSFIGVKHHGQVFISRRGVN